MTLYNRVNSTTSDRPVAIRQLSIHGYWSKFFLQGSHSYASVKFHDFSMTFPWLYIAFFHDYFTRFKCKIYEKCCNNHHTRTGHTFAPYFCWCFFPCIWLLRAASPMFWISKDFRHNLHRAMVLPWYCKI